MLIATVDNAKRIIHFCFSKFSFEAVISWIVKWHLTRIFFSFFPQFGPMLNSVARVSVMICQIKAQHFSDIFDIDYTRVCFKDTGLSEVFADKY